MTEEQWRTCVEPWPMVECLRTAGKFSERKVRLWACACARRCWASLRSERSRGAVVVSERFADGLATAAELGEAREAARRACAKVYTRLRQKAAAPRGDRRFDPDFAAEAARLAVDDPVIAPRTVAAAAFFANPLNDGTSAKNAAEQETLMQAALLRDCFGPLPFRSVPFDFRWLAWREGTVGKMAGAAYHGRRLPSGHLVEASLAVLADALEEAGCENEEVLAHCRSAGQHVRGCWVVDLVLRKE